MENNKIIIFDDRKIRRIWHNDEWYYSVVDIIGALTESSNPNNYWKVLKHRENQLVTICNQLKLPSSDGKYYETDCVNTKSALRLIQSIPSPKAEPFKRWLAKVGYERIQEIEDPELAQERMKDLYEQKGYSKEWIDKRLRGIAIRQELTEEWKNRGVDKNIEYAILTNEISKATFGKTVGEYKQFKELGLENLRDHMTDLELIFSMLGEKVTTEITQNEEAIGLLECKGAAKRGGRVAGKARVDAEKEIGKPIVSKENYLIEPEKQRKLKKGGQNA
ncbi:MAG: Bro-N domain-containing protein [Candidatus Methanoperedens sp.]|nr:Bro-N domain-containing protein [Candidatus Methanoperedens sp.]PKL54396.1 MAG: phage antirepressor protein [Candidatus Methanoperedenaceae archaeon HGW-Methanoperedenaceae-1]